MTLQDTACVGGVLLWGILKVCGLVGLFGADFTALFGTVVTEALNAIITGSVHGLIRGSLVATAAVALVDLVLCLVMAKEALATLLGRVGFIGASVGPLGGGGGMPASAAPFRACSWKTRQRTLRVPPLGLARGNSDVLERLAAEQDSRWPSDQEAYHSTQVTRSRLFPSPAGLIQIGFVKQRYVS